MKHIYEYNNFVNESYGLPLYDDMLTIFLKGKTFQSNYIQEIFNDIRYNSGLKDQDKNEFLLNSDFYKDLQKIWDKYKDNHIIFADKISKETSKAMDKYNNTKWRKEKREKETDEKNTKKGKKHFGDLLIEYKLTTIPDNIRKKIKDDIANKYDKLLYIEKYIIKDFPEPDSEKNEKLWLEWLKEIQKYNEPIENWAEENNYYLWSY